MTKKIFIVLIFAAFVFINTNNIFAVDPVDCSLPENKQNVECVFGKITPPPAIKDFIGTDKTGAYGISQFLSNLIVLIYSIAGIVLIFMLIWGAFEWLTSGGDKEHLAAAQKRIINAVVGILLFAVAFAIIRVLGVFTGFTFFTG